ncbi:protein-L-isoaspartate O-methyltransferase family protein [Halogranum rubrum]|uniref:protein-L-isoaspartate(D-aspartate) O-methyltransferase n=1 Tax=Halogranum salarium B-1 TaxID=1210908 RepID=J3JFR0_9EURY|nr:protein-L-isoaspartate O-methyltransferase [Halogranum salarium]EJN59441.1 protein-l-isoaspartate carboxylmethyltransferase [Halogranum salarium B-1]
MDPAVLRDDMVDGLEEALSSELVDEDVAMAMRTVPRHEFVGDRAYENRDSERGGTRVLAPGTVARMLSGLDAEPGDDVLIVGAGVGYTAAVVADLVGDRHVHAVDINRNAVIDARENLRKAGCEAVLVDCRDGANGMAEYAPFDCILVEAAAVRPPRALLDQLADGGRLVMPMGGPEQTLVAVEASDDSEPNGFDVVDEYGPAAFNPILVDGEQAGGLSRNRMEREDREFAQQGYFAKSGWEYEWVDWDDRLDGR